MAKWRAINDHLNTIGLGVTAAFVIQFAFTVIVQIAMDLTGN